MGRCEETKKAVHSYILFDLYRLNNSDKRKTENKNCFSSKILYFRFSPFGLLLFLNPPIERTYLFLKIRIHRGLSNDEIGFKDTFFESGNRPLAFDNLNQQFSCGLPYFKCRLANNSELR